MVMISICDWCGTKISNWKTMIEVDNHVICERCYNILKKHFENHKFFKSCDIEKTAEQLQFAKTVKEFISNR